MKPRKRIRVHRNAYLSFEVRREGKGFDVHANQYGLTREDVISIFEKLYTKRKALTEFIFGGKL